MGKKQPEISYTCTSLLPGESGPFFKIFISKVYNFILGKKQKISFFLDTPPYPTPTKKRKKKTRRLPFTFLKQGMGQNHCLPPHFGIHSTKNLCSVSLFLYLILSKKREQKIDSIKSYSFCPILCDILFLSLFPFLSRSKPRVQT